MDSPVPFSITALAEAIAAQIPNSNELALIGVFLAQLGSTIQTIAAIRDYLEPGNNNRIPL